MGVLVAIDQFQQAARLKRDHFLASNPHPFLVHATGELQALDPARRDDLTSDRLVIKPPHKALHEAMRAVPLVPRDVDADRVTIGVATTCDIVLDDASVSKRHAWFHEQQGLWHVTDADSSAGTQVNGVVLAVAMPRVLTSGDIVTLGYVDVMFLAPEGFYDLVKGLFGKSGSGNSAVGA